MNSTLALISGLGLGLGLETSGLGLGLGLGLEALGLGLGLLALALKLPALLTSLEMGNTSEMGETSFFTLISITVGVVVKGAAARVQTASG